MFSQASVILGCVCGKGGHAWQKGAMRDKGVCMVKRACMVKGACVAKGGMCGKVGHAWQKWGHAWHVR